VTAEEAYSRRWLCEGNGFLVVVDESRLFVLSFDVLSSTYTSSSMIFENRN
jgi:hypothetical protein